MRDPTPINLRQARKARTRAEARAESDANAAKFGRSKAERRLQQAQAEQARHRLDQHKLTDEPE